MVVISTNLTKMAAILDFAKEKKIPQGCQSGTRRIIDLDPLVDSKKPIKHCMYVCMYVCMHACMHAYMHTYIHTCMHACIHTTYIHTCMHTYIHACMHAYICLFEFNVPSTARSFRDGTPIYCPLRRT